MMLRRFHVFPFSVEICRFEEPVQKSFHIVPLNGVGPCFALPEEIANRTGVANLHCPGARRSLGVKEAGIYRDGNSLRFLTALVDSDFGLRMLKRQVDISRKAKSCRHKGYISLQSAELLFLVDPFVLLGAAVALCRDSPSSL